MKKYIPSQLEPKWQKIWEDNKTFSPDINQASKPFYNLWMFPYPSGEGLHVGHFYASTGSDIFGRYKRMKGYDVFQPIGYDAFGIHSENYALKVGKHPGELIETTTKRYEGQLKETGHAYDWSRTVNTSHEDYYKWTQWLFLQMYKQGLAYKKKSEVNWCPSCLTVLSDEQVISGECERCGSKVIRKLLEQWFFKITSYAEKLLSNLETLNWSEKVKNAQINWIGKSEGAVIEFRVQNSEFRIPVFTTRVDTIFGATFLVLAPEHPMVKELTVDERKVDVERYVEVAKNKSEVERKENKEKSGVFTGGYVTNPATGERIPVWIADYVLYGYGTGAIMAVPAHDERDFEFARKFDLPIKQVISKNGHQEELTQAYIEDGVLINSAQFNGLTTNVARSAITKWLSERNLGNSKVEYHLRDWLISRQRYWGPPIPIIYCDKCGIVPVPEEDLPVKLPFVANFQPTGTGKSPLATDENFVNVKCPNCKGDAKRETDVSDTFLDSAWYFLRYPSSDIENKAFDIERTKKWLPVDMYIGGAEHSVLHLLYSRFTTMVLKDGGFIDFEEPFTKFRAHGLLIKDGAKMSKSRGNVVVPDLLVKEYGADTLRTYLMFMGPFEDGGDFRDKGINGLYRFLQRVWNLDEKISQNVALEAQDLTWMHQTIHRVETEIEALKYNTALAALMEWLNYLSAKKGINEDEYKVFLKLLAPFAPHITEELWQELTINNEQLAINNSIHLQQWPKLEEKYLEKEEVEIAVQVNGKLREILLIGKDIVNDRSEVEKVALGSPKVQKFMAGTTPKKIIYIPGKIVSIVV